MAYLSRAGFIEQIKSRSLGGVVEGAPVYRGFSLARAEPVATVGPRRFAFRMSDESLDRYNSHVMLAGWKLDQFRANPVLPWCHDTAALPIGTWPAVNVQLGVAMTGDADFSATYDVYPLARTVCDLVAAGVLRACSVSWQADRYEEVTQPNGKWGINYLEQTLLEASIVPVPGNANALITSRKIDLAPMAEWTQRALEEPTDLVDILADIHGVDQVAVVRHLAATERACRGFAVTVQVPRQLGATIVETAPQGTIVRVPSRAGAKLSKANKALAKQAHAAASEACKHMQSLLDCMPEDLEDPEEPEKNAAPSGEQDTIEIVDIVEPLELVEPEPLELI